MTLPVQQKDLASFLGARPETLSKRMRALVRDDVLARRGRRDIALRDLALLEEHAAAID